MMVWLVTATTLNNTSLHPHPPTCQQGEQNGPTRKHTRVTS